MLWDWICEVVLDCLPQRLMLLAAVSQALH
jgi:hypothetical protein